MKYGQLKVKILILNHNVEYFLLGQYWLLLVFLMSIKQSSY